MKVGNVEKTTTPIKFKTEYKADANTAYNTQVTETEGKDGESTTTKTYVVDASTGALSNPTASTQETKATNKVVKVGNVDTKTTEIQFKKIEKNDASLKKGERKVQTQGKNGSDVVITTYVVDPVNGLTNTVESVRGKHIDAVDEVVLVGTKEDLTPTPTPEPPTPEPPTPEPPTPEPPTPEAQHDSSAPAVMDTQEAEVLPGKMKYEADDTLPFNTQKKISDPVDGLKVTTHTGSFVNGAWVPSDKVETTPAQDGLTKVGNKQVTHDGDKTITTTYDVDPDTGELTNPQTHTSMPASTLTPAHTTPSTPSTPNLMPTPTPVPSTPGLISAPTSTPINPSADLHQPKHMHERVTPKTGESSSLASLWSIIGLPITALGILYKKKNKKQDK